MRTKIKRAIEKTSKYLFLHRWQFVFLLGSFVIINYVSEFPYLNVIITFSYKIVIFWLLSFYVLNLPPKSSFLVALILLMLAMIETLRNRTVRAEMLGVIVYFFFVIGFLQNFLTYLRELKHKHD